MARSRLLKPDFFDDEKMADLPFAARLLFEALWCLADREGRLEDRPEKIAAFAFPYDKPIQKRARKEAPSHLDALVSVGCAVRYEVEGQRLILLPHFKDHQKIHDREAQSVLPPPQGDTLHALGVKPHAQGRQFPPEASREAEAERDTEAEREAETRAGALSLSPPWPDEPGFVGEYVRHYEKRVGKSPPGQHVTDAAQIEQEFGTEACTKAAEETNWEKPPNWLKPRLHDRKVAAVIPERPKSRRFTG